MEMDDKLQEAELQYELGLKEAALEAKIQAVNGHTSKNGKGRSGN